MTMSERFALTAHIAHRAANAQHSTLIVTFTDIAAFPYALNWATQLNSIGLRSLVGVSTMPSDADEVALDRAGAIPFCADGPMMRKNGQAGRWAEVGKLLRYGMHVLLSDADVGWIRTPLPYFAAAKQAHPELDLLLCTDRADNGFSQRPLSALSAAATTRGAHPLQGKVESASAEGSAGASDLDLEEGLSSHYPSYNIGIMFLYAHANTTLSALFECWVDALQRPESDRKKRTPADAAYAAVLRRRVESDFRKAEIFRPNPKWRGWKGKPMREVVMVHRQEASRKPPSHGRQPMRQASQHQPSASKHQLSPQPYHRPDAHHQAHKQAHRRRSSGGETTVGRRLGRRLASGEVDQRSSGPKSKSAAKSAAKEEAGAPGGHTRAGYVAAWDQGPINEVVLREGLERHATDPRLIATFGGRLAMGVLPMLQFTTAFTYFVHQGMRERLAARPFSLHAIYSHGKDRSRKRWLLREAMLWHDPPAYYTEGRFLSFEPIVSDRLASEGGHEVVISQLRQLASAVRLAGLLNRSLLLPRLRCGDTALSYPCHATYHRGYTSDGLAFGRVAMPAFCPTYYWLSYREADHSPVPLREPSFLHNPRVPTELSADRARLQLCRRRSCRSAATRSAVAAGPDRLLVAHPGRTSEQELLQAIHRAEGSKGSRIIHVEGIHHLQLRDADGGRAERGAGRSAAVASVPPQDGMGSVGVVGEGIVRNVVGEGIVRNVVDEEPPSMREEGPHPPETPVPRGRPLVESATWRSAADTAWAAQLAEVLPMSRGFWCTACVITGR